MNGHPATSERMPAEPKMISDQDNRLIRAWRRGELSEDDAMAFESRLFLEPELRQAVEIDQSMAAALSHVESRPASRRVESRARQRVNQGAQFLLAASVGAAAVLPFALDLGNAGNHAQAVEWVSVSNRRSAATDAVMLLQPAQGTQLIALDIAVTDEQPVDVELFDLRGVATGVRAETLSPRDGSVGFAFKREALAAGDYRVRVSRDGHALASPDVTLRYQP